MRSVELAAVHEFHGQQTRSIRDPVELTVERPHLSLNEGHGHRDRA